MQTRAAQLGVHDANQSINPDATKVRQILRMQYVITNLIMTAANKPYMISIKPMIHLDNYIMFIFTILFLNK